MSFARPDLIVDPSVLAENAKAELAAKLPGWDADSDPVTSALIEAFAGPAAEQAQGLELELIDAFKGIGSLHGIRPIAAQSATSLATVKLSAAAPSGGYSIPLGALVGVYDSNGQLQAFRLTADLPVAAGATTAVGTVEAVTPGTEGNSLGGGAVLIDTPSQVETVTLATSGGGEEEEEESAFLDRLTEELELVKVGAVKAADAAGMARKVAGVGRATAVDLLKPAAADGGEGSEETNAERATTVAVTASDGTTVSSGVRSAVLAMLNEGAVANMRFFVVNPHYEKIDAATTVFGWPGQEPAQVKAEVIAALSRLFSPETAQIGPSGNPARWANDPVIRQSEVFAAINSVPGVRWCSAATFGTHGGALSAADHTLVPSSKVPALPEVGTMTVTVESTT